MGSAPCGRAFRTSMIAACVVSGIIGLGSCRGALAQGPQPEMPHAKVDPHDISGYWELGVDSRSVPAADLTPAAKAMMPKMADADAISLRWCRPLGVPAEMDAGRPVSIIQGKYEALETFPVNGTHRHLYFRAAHVDPNIYDPTSVGDSIAHWEGDTMIVETTGFHAKNGRMLIPGGGYRSDKSKLTEKYTMLKDGQILSVTSTWTDPAVFKTPHTYEFRYYRINGTYEPLPAIGCDPYDDDRAAFVQRTFSPALKKAAADAYSRPGSGAPAK